jgi:hypothetical protein
MAMSLSQCAKLLAREGVRHHLDVEEGAIRAVFVTRSYRNLRGEKLLIVRLDAPDDGHRCRAAVHRAFPASSDPAATCLACCRMAADTPLVGVEYEADTADVRLVVETVVEDGKLTQLQLLTMVDRLVEAAETWSAAGVTGHAAAAGRRPRRPRGAA